MKYLLALFFITSTVHFSQLTAQKFVDTSNLWITSEGFFDIRGGRYYGQQYAYEFRDTLQADGKVYHKLYKSSSPHSHFFENYGAAYRETADGKVYSKRLYRDGEYLLMDQSLEVGDTLRAINSIDDQAVIAVDSVLLADGSFRKRIELENCSSFLSSYWTVGIGFDKGLDSDATCLIDAGRSIDCYYKNGEFLYDPRAIGSCLDTIDRYQGKFVNPDNRWYTYEGSAFPNGYVSNYWYQFQDTVIRNGKTYAKLFRSDLDPYNINEDQKSYWREDAEGRVFKYAAWEPNQEVLVYDFNLTVGDSMDFIGNKIPVTNVDTVELSSGGQRKRITLQRSSGQPLHIVDGIGASRGTFSGQYWITDWFNDLYCFYEGIRLRYTTEGNEGRCITLDIEEPIVLSGKEINSEIELIWQHQFNDDILYMIEWSDDLESWEDIGELDGQSSPHLNFVDKEPVAGINYYRIKGIDNKDKVFNSNVISVKLETETEISIYPNPADGELNISGIQKGTYRIYDTVGSLMMDGNYSEESIDISHLSVGVYFINIFGETQEHTILKFIKS